MRDLRRPSSAARSLREDRLIPLFLEWGEGIEVLADRAPSEGPRLMRAR